MSHWQAAYQRYLTLGLSGVEAFACLEQALHLRLTQLAVLPVRLTDLERWQKQMYNALSSNAFATPLPDGAAERSPARQSEVGSQAFSLNALQTLWERYLGQRPELEQRFSELGGDSLAALQMKAALEHSWDLDVPLPLLLEDLPLEAFYQRLVQQQSAPATEHKTAGADKQGKTEAGETQAHVLIPLNRNQGRPLYFVHAISGTVFPFQEMAQHYRGPLVGVQSHGLSQGRPFSDIEEMAAAYCRAIERDTAPPYKIGGWSFGALVAFAMARHWYQRQLPVQELILLDMRAPDQQGELHLDEGALTERFETDLAGLGLSNSAMEREFCETLRQIFQAHVQATQSFQASVLPIPARLWVAREGFGQTHAEADLGWGSYLPQLKRVQIPGDHYSCLHEANVLGWLEQLNASAVQGEASPETD